MLSKFSILFVTVPVILVTSCADQTAKDSNSKVTTPTEQSNGKVATGADLSDINKAMKDAHTAQNSIDYEGHYAGILKDQAGKDSIGFHIILDGAADYELDKKVYKGKEFVKTVEKGVFEWDKTGNNIVLMGGSKMVWMVSENKLILVDKSLENYKFSNTNKFEIEKHTAE